MGSYPGLSGWVLCCHHRVLMRDIRGRGREVTTEAEVRAEAMPHCGSEAGGGALSQGVRAPCEAETGQESDRPGAPEDARLQPVRPLGPWAAR